jgi:hypothetical protein
MQKDVVLSPMGSTPAEGSDNFDSARINDELLNHIVNLGSRSRRSVESELRERHGRKKMDQIQGIEYSSILFRKYAEVANRVKGDVHYLSAQLKSGPANHRSEVEKEAVLQRELQNVESDLLRLRVVTWLVAVTSLVVMATATIVVHQPLWHPGQYKDQVQLAVSLLCVIFCSVSRLPLFIHTEIPLQHACRGYHYEYPHQFNLRPYLLVIVVDILVVLHITLLLTYRCLPVDEQGQKYVPGTSWFVRY